MIQNMSINQGLIVFLVGFSMENGRKAPIPDSTRLVNGKKELSSDF